MQKEAPKFVEKRRHSRHRARTRVNIRAAGIPGGLYRAANLSAEGVFVLTGGLGLAPGTAVELVFIIELGSVIKLHHRLATVVHVFQGGTGFKLGFKTR